MYIITQMKNTGSITLFPKSIIFAFGRGTYISACINVIQKLLYIFIMSWEEDTGRGGEYISPVPT